jgi:DNA polymerase alpha subunit B
VVTVGGSITAGQGAIDAPNWPQYVLNYMQDNYGDKAVQGRIQCVKLSRVLIILVSDSETFRLPLLRPSVVNSAVGGTISSYMSACHNLHVPKDADIIFVEYRRACLSLV